MQAEGLDALKHGATFDLEQFNLATHDFFDDMGLMSLASGGRTVYAVTPGTSLPSSNRSQASFVNSQPGVGFNAEVTAQRHSGSVLVLCLLQWPL
jgi:hypothetical protein